MDLRRPPPGPARAEEARAYLEKTRFQVLGGKPAYSRAHDLGLSMIEAQYKAPREQAIALVRAAIARYKQLVCQDAKLLFSETANKRR